MSIVNPTMSNEAAIEYFCGLVRQESAIVLEASKTYLIQARLEPIAKAHGFASLCELAAKAKASTVASTLRGEIVDAMTTNETSFFRDFHPFEMLKKEVLPPLIERRRDKKTLCIWCAASSSGQEPYTIAMLIRENFPALSDWKIDFVASDISPTMIRRCEEGFYSQIEINRGLPAPYLVKYFKQEGSVWRIREDLRKSIGWRKMNLISSWPLMPKFDIIFIRNVLIYFDIETKRGIFGNLRNQLAPDGALFLGTAETTINLDESLVREFNGKATYYRIGSQPVPAK